MIFITLQKRLSTTTSGYVGESSQTRHQRGAGRDRDGARGHGSDLQKEGEGGHKRSGTRQ